MHVLNFISRASDSNLAALLCGQLRLEEARKALETGRKLNRAVEAPSNPPALCGASLAADYNPQIQLYGPPVSRKQVLAGPGFALGFIVS